MRIIALIHLKAFWEKYPDSEQQLKAWLDDAKKATWTNPNDIKVRYGNASILKSRRVVFNIKVTTTAWWSPLPIASALCTSSLSALIAGTMRSTQTPWKWSNHHEHSPNPHR